MRDLRCDICDFEYPKDFRYDRNFARRLFKSVFVREEKKSVCANCNQKLVRHMGGRNEENFLRLKEERKVLDQ